MTENCEEAFLSVLSDCETLADQIDLSGDWFPDDGKGYALELGEVSIKPATSKKGEEFFVMSVPFVVRVAAAGTPDTAGKSCTRNIWFPKAIPDQPTGGMKEAASLATALMGVEIKSPLSAYSTIKEQKGSMVWTDIKRREYNGNTYVNFFYTGRVDEAQPQEASA